MKRILALMILVGGNAAVAAANCNYPSAPGNADAAARAKHQNDLINNATQKVQQWCQSVVAKGGGDVQNCLATRSYLSELCSGSDKGFPLLLPDQRFTTTAEYDVLNKVSPTVGQ